MTAEACQDMMAVLPHRLSDYNPGIRMNAGEDIHAHPLIPNKPMTKTRVIRMSSLDSYALTRESGRDPGFHLRLGRPAGLIGRLPEVSACHQQDLVRIWSGQFR
jgi:hypothetical protein